MAKITQAALDRFKHLFRGRENCYGQFQLLAPPPESGDDAHVKHVNTINKPVTDRAFQQHLSGQGPTLGICPINQANMAYFGAIDVDDDGVDLRTLALRVGELGLPLVTCRSKSGGAHLYVFLRDPAPAKLFMDKLRVWAAALGHSHNADSRPIEIFPKQPRLKKDEGGSWINLPYYDTDTTNRYAIEVDVTGVLVKLSLDEFLGHAEEKMVSAAQFEVTEPRPTGGEEMFVEGPPCLQKLHQIGYPAGTRNQGLFNIALFFRLAFPDDWQDQLANYNETSGRIDPPLGEKDLRDLVKSVEKREYVYKCSELPLAPNCNKAECKRRRFGISAFQRKKTMEMFPELSQLTKIMTDPPRWGVMVNGNPMDLTTDDLMALVKFRRTCLEKLSIIVPMIKQAEWDEIIRDLLTDHEIIEAPEDAGTLGQFRHLVNQFIALRKKSEERADLTLGKPYEEGGRVYFRSTDLAAFLERFKFKDYALGRVYTELRKLGADHTQFNVDGTNVKVWWLPAPEDDNQKLKVPVDKIPTF